MDFSKELNKGRRIALEHEPDLKWLTFQVDRRIREKAVKKAKKCGISLSAFLRVCTEKFIELPIDYHIKNMYGEIYKDAVEAFGLKKEKNKNRSIAED